MNQKRGLIIAPHPDDEILLGGQLMMLLQDQVEFFVLLVTNGDFTVKLGNKRMAEAVKSLSVLGIGEDHVLFLGYPNDWEGPTHLYNAQEDQVLISAIGKTRTNGTQQLPEYCFLRSGQHHEFTRKNFKTDLRAVMEEIRADLLVCVDYDTHPDHRAISLLTEEILGEMFQEDPQYRPVVLKKFAYNGVWHGEKDYYSLAPTKHKSGFCYGGGIHELENPTYRWDDRLALETPQQTRTPLLCQNPLYRAARKHRHTTAWYEMRRVINADVVYWWRPTENLLFEADLVASSGECRYVRDFKFFDSGNVMEEGDSLTGKEYAWRPDHEDARKELRVHFSKPVSVSQLHVYEDFQSGNHIKSLEIQIGTQKYTMEPMPDGTRTELRLENAPQTDLIVFRVLDAEGSPGISELELFSKPQSFWEQCPSLKEAPSEWESFGIATKLLQNAERIRLLAEFAVRFKIAYEWKRLIQKLQSRQERKN